MPELAVLAAQVAAPEKDVETNGDLVELLLDYEEALQVCNGRLGAIRRAYGGEAKGGGHAKVE